MISLWRQITRTLSHSSSQVPASAFLPASSRFFSRSSPYLVKVGIPEFLNGIGKGAEAHMEKLESEFGDLQRLLVTRTLKLKKLEIPCKHIIPKWIWKIFYFVHVLVSVFIIVIACLQRKLILKYAHKYRLGLWRPRADQMKV